MQKINKKHISNVLMRKCIKFSIILHMGGKCSVKGNLVMGMFSHQLKSKFGTCDNSCKPPQKYLSAVSPRDWQTLWGTWLFLHHLWLRKQHKCVNGDRHTFVSHLHQLSCADILSTHTCASHQHSARHRTNTIKVVVRFFPQSHTYSWAQNY